MSEQPFNGDGALEADVTLPGTDAADQEEMPKLQLRGQHALLFGFFVLSALAFLYFLLPRITGLQGTWNRINHGDPFWLGVAILLECCSFLGYVLLFRTVFVRGQNSRIDWRESYQITMAGLAATRLFAAAGAGGVVLTAWALRRSGMEPRLVACRMVAFMVILYTVYAASMLIDGIALATGAFPGGGSFAITVVPAIAGFVLFVITGAVALLPKDLERTLQGWAA